MPKKPRTKKSTIEKISSNKVWLFIVSLCTVIAGVLSAVQLLQIFEGDTQIAWNAAVVALAFLAIFLIWFSFFAKIAKVWKWVARILLIITVISPVGVWVYKQYKQQLTVQENQNKVIVVIAQFDGPEETFGLRNQILEQLNASLGGDKDIKIIPINETVTIAQGSTYARQLGQQYQADLVFWGWYRPTENPELTLHIENLSPSKFDVLQQSETYKPQATIAELQSFSLQQKIGEQTSTLVSFLGGLLSYKAQDYETAIKRFQYALNQPDWSNELINQVNAYLDLGYIYNITGKYQDAITNYNKAIKLNPQLGDAYNDRGVAYYNQKDYTSAIADYNYAIQIDSQDAFAYVNRGDVYADQGEYTLAIDDFDQAIRINPQLAQAYYNRGTTYSNEKQYTTAINDFNQAIQINPKYEEAYYNLGYIYGGQGQYTEAIDSFSQAIQIDPQDYEAYNNRGLAYANQRKYSEAIADLNQAIEINPQAENPYSVLHESVTQG